MTDYGHELEFGLFPSPDAAAAHHVLELAAVAEVSGLDLVTMQDHPYQAAHLDAWTLLSVIAARTSDAAGRAQRGQPAAAPPGRARPESVASLDLLSGGRVELGIGTGAFWDAIEAAGGARLSPGEAVEALEEAIGVIRAMWAGEGSVRVDGEHHRRVGLHSGPAPAHPVGIWVGAYKPRMLRLTGRLADGWLPSLGYAAPDAARRAERAHRRGGRRRPGGPPRPSGGSTTSRVVRLGRRLPARAGRRTGPSSSPSSPSSRGWPRTSWPPTTSTTCAGSARRWRRWCATSSPPSASAAPTQPDRGCRAAASRGAVTRAVVSRSRDSSAAGGSGSTGRRHTDTRRRHPAHRHPAVGRVQPADLPGAARPGRAGGLQRRPSWRCRSTSWTCTTTCGPS